MDEHTCPTTERGLRAIHLAEQLMKAGLDLVALFYEVEAVYPVDDWYRFAGLFEANGAHWLVEHAEEIDSRGLCPDGSAAKLKSAWHEYLREILLDAMPGFLRQHQAANEVLLAAVLAENEEIAARVERLKAGL